MLFQGVRNLSATFRRRRNTGDNGGVVENGWWTKKVSKFTNFKQEDDAIGECLERLQIFLHVNAVHTEDKGATLLT